MKASFNFQGEQALVTGASRGIGYAVARGFAAAGARVRVLAEDDAVYEAARNLAAETSGEVDAVRCDVSDPAEVSAAVSDLERVDILVNNAGIELMTPASVADDDDDVRDSTFERIMSINVVGTWQMTRAVLPLMGRGGRILVTSSIWGRTSVPRFAGYAASKHALIGIVRTLAMELGPKGLRVNAVCPGWVRTQAALRSLSLMAEEQGRSEDDMAVEIADAQSLDGLMDPSDVAGMYLYLASDAADSVTGQAIPVDRGEVMA